MINSTISSVLNKQMTRKEFLKYLGMIFIGVFGISSLIKSLSQLDTSQKDKRIQASGKKFGSGAYGG